MIDSSDAVQHHYEGDAEGGDIVARVKQMLAQRGNQPLTTAELGALDQFHSGGLAATRDFVELLQIKPGTQVLDAGSGLGGPSRYIAERFACHVTGVDLAPSFVEVAGLLAEHTGMGERVQYRVGNLLDLELADATFDLVYTQHVVMNIRDRDQVYREVHRVLKPGGHFGFYDVLAVDGQPEPLYPVPWSQTADNSVLLSEQQTRASLAQAGLQVEVWHDVSAQAIQWFANMRTPSMDEPSLAVVMGPRFPQMSANFARNLSENRIQLVMAKMVKA